MTEYDSPAPMIALSFVVAFALTVVRLPEAVAVFRPDWVALLVIYWALTWPGRTGPIVAGVVGVLLDALLTTHLGQHALALAVIAFAAAKLHLRIRVFPVSQQALAVAGLLAVYHFILLWIDGMLGRPVFFPDRWLPVLTGALVWLPVSALMGSLQRQRRAHR